MNSFSIYILRSISYSFFVTFIPILSVLILIILNKILNISTIIDLKFLDIIKFFFTSTIDIVVYSLTLSFILTATTTLKNLSEKSELIVAFSLGIKPTLIVRILALLGGLMSMVTIILFIFIQPYLKIMKNNLEVDVKNRNIKMINPKSFTSTNELSIIKNENINRYILYTKNSDDINIFKNIESIKTNYNGINLNIGEGKLIQKYSDSVDKIIYEKATILYRLVNIQKIPYMGYLTYIKNYTKKSRVIMKVLIAMMPFLFMFIIPIISISHNRYRNKSIYLYIVLSIGLYIGLIQLFIPLGYLAIIILPTLFLLTTYILYRKIIYEKY